MKNYFFFNPSEWNFNPACTNNVGGMKPVTSFDGTETIAYQIGDWNSSWTEITTGSIELLPNTDYTFSFWLNGGENDRFNEVCQFQIIKEDNWDTRIIHLLNRRKPLIYKNGWNLFEINFSTDDSAYYELRFVSMGAVTTIAPAQPLEEYDDIIPDEIPETEKQRSNIVFEKGWPDENSNYNNKKSFLGNLKKPIIIAGVVISSILLIKKLFKRK